jgi:molybdate transport system substrate-binding protein
MKRTFVLAALACLAGCRPQPPAELNIAAAANLTEVFGKLGPQFEHDTGIHASFSFASTAQLARQIENGAPFDIFAAADAEHVGQLEQKGFIAPGSRTVYTRGVLALWFPSSDARIQDLTLASVRVIAVAKPELAPYGQATVDSLRKLGIWQQVQPKIVYAENISMAKQYGTSKNADAVFTAYSLVLHESGKVIQVDETLHKPINQELGIVAKSNHQDDAKRFVTYLLTGAGKSILSSYGYQQPAASN